LTSWKRERSRREKMRISEKEKEAIIACIICKPPYGESEEEKRRREKRRRR